jgi:hypothetical protein
LQNISNSTAASNVVVDNFNSITLDNSVDLGLYVTGSGAAGLQTILSSRSDLGTAFRGPSFTIRKNLIIPGTGANDANIVLGQSTAAKIVYHDFPAVAGQNGLVIQTGGVTQGRPCLLIQANDASTQGAVGGGLCIGGNSTTADPSFAHAGAGYTGDGATYTARGTTASGVQFNDGIMNFFSNSSLTPGNTFSPTTHIRVGGANILSVDGTAGFSGTKTAGSCTFTILYGIITNVTGC